MKIKIDENTVKQALELLDIQRKHCFDSGCELIAKQLYQTSRKGNQEQLAYYNGHVNALEYLFQLSDYVLTVDIAGKHHIEKREF